MPAIEIVNTVSAGTHYRVDHAGILLGKSGLGIIEDGKVLAILSNLGFIFLMFLSGLEIDFSGLRFQRAGDGENRWRRIFGSHIVLGLMAFAATLILSFGIAWLLRRFQLSRDVWMMGLILSTTSLGVVVPVLKEYGAVKERFGQLILYCALVADFGSILLISVYVLFSKRGVSAEVLLILLLFVIFTAVYRSAALFQRHLPAQRFFDEISSATSQIKLRGALALVLVFTVLANSLGVEMILRAFLAGVIISMLTDGGGSELREKLDALGYGFLIPIFFIKVGADFDLPALLASESTLAIFPVLLISAYVVKFAPSLLFLPFYSRRESFGAGALMSARLSLIIAAAMIGREIGAISDAVNSAILLLAIITCTLSPLAFKWIAPSQPAPREGVIIMGCRNLVELLGERLRKHHEKVEIRCIDNEERKGTTLAGAPSFKRRPAVAELLREAGADRARTLVALEERDEDNLLVCRIARSVFGVPNMIAWVQDTASEGAFAALEARVVNPSRATLLLIEAMAVNPDYYRMVQELDTSISIEEVKLKRSPMAGRRIEEVTFPDNVTVIGISRGGELMVPDNQTELRANDTLTLLGSPSGIEETLKRLRNTVR